MIIDDTPDCRSNRTLRCHVDEDRLNAGIRGLETAGVVLCTHASKDGEGGRRGERARSVLADAGGGSSDHDGARLVDIEAD